MSKQSLSRIINLREELHVRVLDTVGPDFELKLSKMLQCHEMKNSVNLPEHSLIEQKTLKLSRRAVLKYGEYDMYMK